MVGCSVVSHWPDGTKACVLGESRLFPCWKAPWILNIGMGYDTQSQLLPCRHYLFLFLFRFALAPWNHVVAQCRSWDRRIWQLIAIDLRGLPAAILVSLLADNSHPKTVIVSIFCQNYCHGFCSCILHCRVYLAFRDAFKKCFQLALSLSKSHGEFFDHINPD